jgi:hypothetical protein
MKFEGRIEPFIVRWLVREIEAATLDPADKPQDDGAILL